MHPKFLLVQAIVLLKAIEATPIDVCLNPVYKDLPSCSGNPPKRSINDNPTSLLAAFPRPLESDPDSTLQAREAIGPCWDPRDETCTRFPPRSIKSRDVNICRAPGEHKCALIVWASLQGNPIPNFINKPGLFQGSPKGGGVGNNGKATSGGRGILVVGGNCDDIVASGELETHSPGWSADITTTYGPHLHFGAGNIGLRTIGGVRFQYNGKSYTQSDCFNTGGTSGLRATDAIQCNFDC